MANDVRDDWERHWGDYAASASANPAQAYRRRLVLSLLDLPSQGARVLDIGSGLGDLVAEIAAACPGCELTGIELSRSGIERSRSLVPAATFLERDLLQPVELDDPRRGWATHAVCSEVLEHVDDPVSLLANARAYLAPNCRLVVTVPGGPMSAYDRHIGHRQSFTPRSLREILTRAGFEVEDAMGAGFPFFDLYRLFVVLRGRRLITDVAGGVNAHPTGLARLAMAAFGVLFRFNLRRSRFGWQMIGVAVERGGPPGPTA